VLRAPVVAVRLAVSTVKIPGLSPRGSPRGFQASLPVRGSLRREPMKPGTMTMGSQAGRTWTAMGASLSRVA
jgi:hypothetical protein